MAKSQRARIFIIIMLIKCLLSAAAQSLMHTAGRPLWIIFSGAVSPRTWAARAAKLPIISFRASMEIWREIIMISS